MKAVLRSISGSGPEHRSTQYRADNQAADEKPLSRSRTGDLPARPAQPVEGRQPRGLEQVPEDVDGGHSEPEHEAGLMDEK